MSLIDWQRERDELKQRRQQRLIAQSQGHAVLLVEGDEDVSVLEALGKRFAPDFSARVVVWALEGRKQVLTELAAAQRSGYARWFGWVDRDLWTDQEVREEQQRLPHLYVTDGWCLESYFCDLPFLEGTLRMGASLQQAIEAAVPAWLAYGAQRWVLTREREAIVQRWPRPTRGQPQRGGAFSPAAWHSDVQSIVEELERSCGAVRAANLVTRIRQRYEEVAHQSAWSVGLPGKDFFRAVVAPALNDALQRKQDALDWMVDLVGRAPREDLRWADPVMAALLTTKGWGDGRADPP